jgi:hypothetical protein
VRQAFHHPLQRLERDAAALADHVQGQVARLQPAFDVGNRRVAALVLAVGEHDQRLAAGLPSEHVHAAQDDVVERRRSPRRQPIDRLDSIGGIGRFARQREHVSLNPSSVT